MSVQNGDVVLVTIGGVTLGALVSNGHNQLADMLDASNKDTPGVKIYQAGESGWNFTLEALFDPAATEGFSEALGYLKAGTQITVTHGISGTSIQSGFGYISNLELSGPKNEISSYSLDIQGTGEIAAGYGPDVVVNGGFDTDTVWTKGAGWVIAAGVATATGASGNLSQSVILTLGVLYELEFTISGYTLGSLEPKLGSTGIGTARSANGTYQEQITCAGSTTLILDATSFSGDVDDVSCKAVL
jgi:hypothetical protein